MRAVVDTIRTFYIDNHDEITSVVSEIKKLEAEIAATPALAHLLEEASQASQTTEDTAVSKPARRRR